jgi:hypothetical protein
MRGRRPSFGFLSLGFPLSPIPSPQIDVEPPLFEGDIWRGSGLPRRRRPHSAGIAAVFQFAQKERRFESSLAATQPPRRPRRDRDRHRNNRERACLASRPSRAKAPPALAPSTPATRASRPGATISRFLTTASWINGETKNSSRPDSVYRAPGRWRHEYEPGRPVRPFRARPHRPGSDPRRYGERLFSVTTSTATPSAFSRSSPSATRSRRLRPSDISTNKSRSLERVASPRLTQPNTRTFRAP